jgi:predicted nucleic acid-binding Zn ribbon protein
VLQKISDPVLTVCLSCGKPSFKKQLTAAGFQLKGTGWYATDFRGGAAPSTALPTGPADASAPAAPAPKEAAPAAPAAAAPAAAPASGTSST